ncbi:hypothetical protein OJ998_24740 [Solirubrobacter taibaiensis]|nr:hypothetical protein [Solirubrobacter taibaiensis]
MRPLLTLLFVLLVPATAQAATLGREGTELVYRSAPGQQELHLLMEDDDGGDLVMIGGDVTPGAGCEGVEVSCSLAGVTTVRVFLGDGNDRFEVRAPVAIVADLGPGNDEFEADGLGAVVTGGPGADHITGFNAENATGPFQLDGGEGDDTLVFAGRMPGITLTGGAGDDLLALALTSPDGAPIDFVCGPGADRAIMEPQDRAGDGCARPVTGLTGLKRVSRTFREGRLEAPARGGVTLRRRTTTGGLNLAVIARRDFSAPAGPLRVRLRTTPDGRRWLDRNPKLPVWVFIRTRTGSDRAEVIFESRLG